MTDTHTHNTEHTAPAELDAPAELGPFSFTLPAAVAAAVWPAVVAVAASAKDRRPVLVAVHVATGPDGVTLTATDTYAMHRVTVPRGLDGSTLPFLPHAPALLPAWKGADVVRLCKGAASVRFTAGTADTYATATPGRVEALDASGAVVATLTGDTPAGEYPAFTGLFDREGWPGSFDSVGFCPARFARSLTAADKLRGKDGTPVAVETMTPMKPARFTLTRPDGVTLTAVLMPHKLPTR
jgi:hypothetical protein